MLTVSLPEAEAVDLVAPLPDGVEVVVWDGLTDRPAGADSIELFVGRYAAEPPPADVLSALPSLRVVQVLSAGVESWLRVVPDGVQLCNGRGIHGASTAELALGGMLAVLRELPAFLDAQRAGRWESRDVDGLDGRRVLVLGAGDIGGRVAAAVGALDAEVTLVARHRRDGVRALDDVPELLSETDVVVIALPSSPETEGLVDAGFLARLPDGALLVNVARGPIVDTDALLAELQSRRLRAFLDVTDPEPLPAGHPLWQAPNVLLTPHVGGGTRGWRRRAYRLVREQIERLVAGEELVNRVTGGY